VAPGAYANFRRAAPLTGGAQRDAFVREEVTVPCSNRRRATAMVRAMRDEAPVRSR
jgi:hypothetical protein